MATQYFCGSQRRRNAVRSHATINGIDYLEVLDLEAPPGSPRQRTLLVRLLKPVPAGLEPSNVRIDGGVRVRPIKVEWLAAASNAANLFAAGMIGAAERDFFLVQPEPDHLLLVRTNLAGDFSTYLLLLVRSSTDAEPPAGFDPLLAQVDFSFKVECPGEFDCALQQDCPPEPVDEPPIDYLAKDYASFRRLILDRLAVIMPEWKERSPADLGIALVEVLAYAGDYLSYYQDAVATEAYLGTARRRTSLRRHARLLDYDMHEGCNARAWLCIEVAEGRGSDGAVLRQRDQLSDQLVRVLTQMPAPAVVAPEELDSLLALYRPAVFELMHNVALYSAHNQISFYTWGDDECCLPKGATRATLVDDADNRLRLRPGDVLILRERIDPGTGEEEDADPARRHAVRLTSVEPQAQVDEVDRRTAGPLLTDELFGQPIVEIEWAVEDALPFPLCISAVINETSVADISVAHGNIVLTDHGHTIPGKPLPPPASAGHLRYRPALAESEVTFTTPLDCALPATRTLLQDPRRALPAVKLHENDTCWCPQRDLLRSSRFAPEFVVEMDDERRATLRFGDDMYGKRPNGDEQFQVRYRIGSGTAGNVGAEALAHLVAKLQDVIRVWNPLPAQGGTAPEAAEAVRQYAPQAFRVQERAVTEEDYAEMAQRHPQVQKAVATRRWTGSWHTMFITVDRLGGLPVDAEFESELRRFLERYRLAGHDIEIDRPRYVALDLALIVCVEEGYFRSEVKAALLQLFSNQDLPDGRRGFFHPDAFTFGQPVYLSQILAAAMDVAGVRWVDVARFRCFGEPDRGEIDAGMIALGRLEIARLENDPNFPENGKLELIMEGDL